MCRAPEPAFRRVLEDTRGLRFAAYAVLFALETETGEAGLLRPGSSEVNLFRDGKGVINLDAEISDCALDLGMTEQ